MKIAVIGAGIHGLCVAKTCSERGHEVVVFEQHKPGNMFGSSFGRSRIVRQAYPDQFYTEILLEGHNLWHELEAQSGRKLVYEVGLLFVAPSRCDELAHELDTLENLGIPHQVLTSKDIRTVHSHMVLEPDEVAVLTFRAGWADVQAVLKVVQSLAQRSGVRFVRQRVTGLGQEGFPESEWPFDCVVLTAGAWATKFLDLPLKTTLQTFAYLETAMDGPVWIEGFGDHMYGFPSEPSSPTFKIGYHTLGPCTDPDSPERNPSAEALQAIKDTTRRRFNVSEPSIVETGCCLYTSADNDDFKFGWVDDRTLFVSPCSGHGFKFGPWIGRFVADLVERRERLSDWPRFVV